MMYPFIYRNFIYPALYFGFRILALFNSKVKLALELRRPQNQSLPWLSGGLKLERPLWFHCASGEFEYAKPVLNLVRQKYPSVPILLTYFSPSALDSIEKFKNIDFFCPLPWDEPQTLQTFLKLYRPRALLIARTDVWPEMMMQTQQMNIPSLMFSATMASRSSRMSFFAKGLTSWTLKKLTEIQCVSQEDFENFKILGLENTTKICGDTRYDQVIARLKAPKPIKDELFRHSPNEKIFVAGSTWPEDEDVLLNAIRKCKKLNYRFVIVPHEPTPTHLSDLRKKAESMGLRTEFYSEVTRWSDDHILIVDQVGILAEIYAYASLAFVGGSFRKSVHSVMEPLAAGCLTLVGPKHLNNREALFMKTLKLKSFEEFSPVCEMKSSKDFIKLLAMIEKKDLDAVGSEIRSLIEARAGLATERVLAWIAPFV